MSATATFWVVIGLITAGSMAMRLFPMLAHGRFETPPVLKRLLAHMPTAVLAALMIPGSVWITENDVYEVSPERIVALIIGATVGYFTKSIIATIAAGLAALWAIQYLF
jgi:branched-subunit amino acid transport protein